ncbi:MAG: NAD(+)/NADH kinase [Clostridia bacterium]|nr:NAD(+)/NADH kinase [Clostridia bacterium]
MAIGIYTNLYKDSDLAVTNGVISILDKAEIEYYIDPLLKEHYPSCKVYDDTVFPTLEMLITVGGDGTILAVGRRCAENKVPILGVNKGTVGFMAEVEPSNLEQLVAIIKRGEYDIDERALLCADCKGEIFYALNEAIVYRGDTKMITVDVKIENQLVDKYACDGFIVCTPTGSTAYSLSAGGAIMSPKVNAIGLTPINSHSLHTRPIIVSGDEVVDISVCRAYEDAMLIIDGVETVRIGLNEDVRFYKSDMTLCFVRLKGSNFYSALLSKLNIWGLTEN